MRIQRGVGSVVALWACLGLLGCGDKGGGVGNDNNDNTNVGVDAATGVDANVHTDGAVDPDAAAPDAGQTPDAAVDAGTTTATPECTDGSQCTLHSDCCNCLALAPGETPPPCNIPTCFVDTCTAMGVDPTQALECPAGGCAVGFNCDDSTVVCMQPTPVCDPGYVPSVTGACWGPCVLATECASVNDCSRCDPSLYLCVQKTAWVNTYHCVDHTDDCAGNMTCSCLAPAVCLSPFDACVDHPAQNEIECACPSC